jgi:hypothetical protein
MSKDLLDKTLNDAIASLAPGSQYVLGMLLRADQEGPQVQMRIIGGEGKVDELIQIVALITATTEKLVAQTLAEVIRANPGTKMRTMVMFAQARDQYANDDSRDEMYMRTHWGEKPDA